MSDGSAYGADERKDDPGIDPDEIHDEIDVDEVELVDDGEPIEAAAGIYELAKPFESRLAVADVGRIAVILDCDRPV